MEVLFFVFVNVKLFNGFDYGYDLGILVFCFFLGWWCV